MDFLANENFPYPSIIILRNRGFNVKSIAEENFGITDKSVIEIAQKENRIILTFDKDYGELLVRYSYSKPPAVVFFRLKGNTPDFAGTILIRLIEQKEIILNNHFTVIDSNNFRQRKY